MIKKVLYTLTIIFTFFGLFSCNSVSLEEYQQIAIADLETYAINKGQANYSENGWTVVIQLVAYEKTLLDNAISKEMVDTLVKEATVLIDNINQEGIIKGKLYSLREAYNQEFLTVEDLRNIAHNHNNAYNVFFPETLSLSIGWSIKLAVVVDLKNDENHPIPDAKPEMVWLSKFLGSYNGSFAITHASYYAYAGYDRMIITEVAGVQFFYSGPETIKIWRCEVVV